MHFDSDIFGRRPSGLNATLALGPQYRVPVDGLGHMQATGPQYVMPVTGLGGPGEALAQISATSVGIAALAAFAVRRYKRVSWGQAALYGSGAAIVVNLLGFGAAKATATR